MKSPQETRYRNLLKKYPEDEKERNARFQEEVSQCYQIVRQGFEKNEWIKFLVDELNDLGCGPITPAFIKCNPCKTPKRGFYTPGRGIQLCSNFDLREDITYTTIVHELLHVYDFCTAKLDINNCVHHACTEIRAINLSGECHMKIEWFDRGKFGKLFKQHQECVRRRAKLTLQNRRACIDVIDESIDLAWKTCFNDYRPFDTIP
mmetsp:Transcript_16862/g.25191  ORF Transcript_16862/g.25191 Transcript_16862/m.25191 type:complete len:205 (-) Transcript_16862:79-693(-)